MITRVQYNDIDNFIDTFSSLAGGKETEIYFNFQGSFCLKMKFWRLLILLWH